MMIITTPQAHAQQGVKQSVLIVYLTLAQNFQIWRSMGCTGPTVLNVKA